MLSLLPRLPTGGIRARSLAKARTAPDGTPAWLASLNLSIGQWGEVTGTNLSSVNPSPAPSGDFTAKVDAWNSFAVDARNSKVYSCCNGGHTDYAGNEVDVIDFESATPAWSEIEPPSPAAQYTDGTAYYNDGKPSSRHTYYGAHVIEADNRIAILGGAYWSTAGGIGSDSAAFSLTTHNYEADGTIADRHAGLAARVPAFVRDPRNDNIFGVANFTIYKWTRETNSWASVGGGLAWGEEAASAWDSTRNRFLILGGDNADHHTYAPDTNSETAQTLSGTQSANVFGGKNALVYVPSLDAYLLRKAASGQTVYKINALTFECTLFSTSGATPSAHVSSGPYNKFLYLPNLGVCVYFPTHTGNVWVLRVE